MQIVDVLPNVFVYNTISNSDIKVLAMESSFIRLCCLLYLLGSVNAVSKVVSLNLNKRAGLQKRASDPVAASKFTPIPHHDNLLY